MGWTWPVRKPIKRKTPLRRSKFNAVRSGGFASKLEAAVFQLLELRVRAGEIDELKRGGVDLGFGIHWNVDFSFRVVATGERMWAEAKGVESERYRICLKLWKGGQGPGRLEIWKGDWRAPRLVEIIKPKEKA